MMVIGSYFPELSTQQLASLAQSEALYQEWNQRINVISRKDMDAFMTRHVLHSLAIAKVIQFRPGTRVLDVGTGGGFPGIPLAIMYPDVQFTLVDSIGKKIRVVETIARELGLKNVDARQLRAEQLKGRFDYVVSRAVAQLDLFCGWIWKLMPIDPAMNGGLYALKGGDLSEEIQRFEEQFPESSVKVHRISNFFSDEFFETKQVIQVNRMA
ncbi:MAG: 16S rRNA (guanine(527)-N(7))-methyltransferase RsmG [Flavobacteriales bacterium]|nr:16S rRNA (guanine(527)-N(7))-methyltransferase RsmG [Flavobacteriales bacterium]